MDNPFENFKLFLKPSDIMDATQYGLTHVHKLIREYEASNPGKVHRRGRHGCRVHRDFFYWFTEHEGMGKGA